MKYCLQHSRERMKTYFRVNTHKDRTHLTLTGELRDVFEDLEKMTAF